MTMISYSNTEEMAEIARDLKNLSDDLDSEINNLFSRFSDVPRVTKEWIGDKAEFYFKIIAQDKKHYLNISKAIRRIGVEILGEADELENIAVKYRNNS